MADRPHDGPRLTIRRGEPDDVPFVVALGETAFARFGEYGPIMRGFLESPDVSAFVAEAAGERVGFALVEAPEALTGLADLVAIAVERRHRRTGVGRALLSSVIASRESQDRHSILVLTVADDNDPAIALFRAHGFQMVPGTLGSYAGGQTSRRMALTIAPRSGHSR